MRRLLALLLPLLLFTGCETQPCEILPALKYELALVNTDPESFFCFSQFNLLDMTDETTLAASFAEGCHSEIDRSCGLETTLHTVCPAYEIDFSCRFQGTRGFCTNDLTALVCHYDAWLDPVR